jgi:microcystin-dependent protein
MDCYYIGTIVLWSASYIPKGWAACNGAVLPITQYAAVYAVLGTQYGGDGINNFALPNLPTVTDVDKQGVSKYIICLDGYFPPHP